MVKAKRVTPYKQKARRGDKKDEIKTDIELVKIDAAKNIAKLEVMTEEEVLRIRTTTAQNALKLFNKLMEEMQKRIPEMSDEVLAHSLLSVWDKSNGKR